MREMLESSQLELSQIQAFIDEQAAFVPAVDVLVRLRALIARLGLFLSRFQASEVSIVLPRLSSRCAFTPRSDSPRREMERASRVTASVA